MDFDILLLLPFSCASLVNSMSDSLALVFFSSRTQPICIAHCHEEKLQDHTHTQLLMIMKTSSHLNVHKLCIYIYIIHSKHMLICPSAVWKPLFDRANKHHVFLGTIAHLLDITENSPKRSFYWLPVLYGDHSMMRKMLMAFLHLTLNSISC